MVTERMQSCSNSSTHSSHVSKPEDTLPQAVVVRGVHLTPASSSRNAEDYSGHDLKGRLITAFHLVGEVQAFDEAVHWYYAPLDDYDRKKIRIDDSVVAAAATTPVPEASESPKIFLRLGVSSTFRRYALPSGLSPTTELLTEAIATLPAERTAVALDERPVRYHEIDVQGGDTAPDTSPLYVDKDHVHTAATAPDLPKSEAEQRSSLPDNPSLPDFFSPLPPEDVDENYLFPSIIPLWSSDADTMIQSSTYRSLATTGASYATRPHESHSSLSMGNHNYDESAVVREGHRPSSSGRLLRCRSAARPSAASIVNKEEKQNNGDDDEADVSGDSGGGCVADVFAQTNGEDLAACCTPILRLPDSSNASNHASASSSMGQSALYQQGGSSITRLAPQKPTKPPSARFRRPSSGVTTTYVPLTQE